MFRKMNEYLQYRRNVKQAKKELAMIAAATLPAIRIASKKKADFILFLENLVKETKDMEGERFVETVLDTISQTLQTNNSRILELLTYLASLEPEEIQKLSVHGIVETSKKTGNGGHKIYE